MCVTVALGAVSLLLSCCTFGKTQGRRVWGVQEELAACGEEVWAFEHSKPEQL